MSTIFSEEWYDSYCKAHGLTPEGRRRGADSTTAEGRRTSSPPPAEDAGDPKRKYRNVPCEEDGRRFDSKHERKIYRQLRLECLAGEHVGFGCQVPFFLPGGVKYVADFVVLEKGGTYSVLDAKSEATRKDKAYRIKRRLMAECLGIVIREV